MTKKIGYFSELPAATQDLIKEAVENEFDPGNPDTFGGEDLEDIECHSRDGFIAFDTNRGGVSKKVFSELDHIQGSGYLPKNKKSQKRINQLIDSSLQLAAEAFHEKNAELLNKLGITVAQCTYHDMEELAKVHPELKGMNEEVAEYEREFLGGENSTVMYDLQALYHGKDERGVHSMSVSTGLNTEAPYHRRKYDDNQKEVVITWRKDSALKNKLSKAIKQVCKAVF